MVIEFSSRKEASMEMYYKLFNEYKAKEFSDILTPAERKDYDRIYNIIKSR
jgi:hypothetical protein